MSGFKPGTIVRAWVPTQHVVGHEQADNPDGPRPWLVVYNRGVKNTAMVVAVPLTTKSKYATIVALPYSDNDVDTQNCASPIAGDGFILLDQVRALSTDRMKDQLPCGQLKPALLARVRGELAAMMSGIARD